jgi:methylmalonyl-CoA mutase cobalamin-binding subunit
VERKQRLVQAGQAVFTNALEKLDTLGIDIKDPLRLLHTLKKLGPGQFEAYFGAGEMDRNQVHRRNPVMITDHYKTLQEAIEKIKLEVGEKLSGTDTLNGRRVVVTSTDVHEHALFVLEQILSFAGTKVFNIGAEKNSTQILDGLIECGGEILAVSTHNGMAYEFALLLIKEMRQRGIEVPVFMGGRLNQNVEGEPLPVDMTDRLRSLNVIPCDSIPQFLTVLAETLSQKEKTFAGN